MFGNPHQRSIVMSKQHLPLRNILRIPTLLFVVLLFAALAWASDPPWKSKPYDQWDEKDIQRVFSDSPWSRLTPVARTWGKYSAKDNQQNPQIGGRDRGIPSSNDTSAENSIGGDVDFFVDWASSRPM